ncbi:MAG TPA: ABC transporter substrate-binding protein [Candidatus Binatia bacterium]|jgi:putative ABC transport system substrate-binding protein
MMETNIGGEIPGLCFAACPSRSAFPGHHKKIPVKQIMRWVVHFVLVVLALLLIGDAGAAERTKPIRIGVLTDSWGPTPGVVGLRDGLQELGYRENKDFVIGVRFTQGDISTLREAARELVQQGADVIFTNNPAPAMAARTATSRIPIVFYGAGDPIGLKLIESFARPGGNITGVTDLDLELDSKRLEIFKEMIPGLNRVLFSYDPAEAFSLAQAKVYRDTASFLKIGLVERPVRTQGEAQATFASLAKTEVHGIIVPRSLSLNIPGLAREATLRQRIPTMFFGAWHAENGGLASYGPNFYESGRQAARLVDKILRGTKPGDIPVEVNNNIEFLINLKVAKALGIKIAPEVLYRASRVIR